MNSKQRELILIFIFIFAVIFVLMDWNNVSWIFNYREDEGLVYDFFNPYPTSPYLVSANESATIKNLIASNANAVAVSGNVISQPPAPAQITALAMANNSLSIPSVNISTPVVIGESTNDVTLENDLDQGAVYYPGSVLPGEAGQIVILGHSAPPGWPPIKHDFIFTNLEKVNVGDQVILTFNNTQYTYKVLSKKIIAQGQDAGTADLSGTNNIMTLVSCWPPGKNYQRIAVVTQLQTN